MGKNDRSTLPVISPRVSRRKVFDMVRWIGGVPIISRNDDRAALPSPVPDDLGDSILRMFGGDR